MSALFDRLSDAQNARIDDLMARMTWEDKLNQLQVTFAMSDDEQDARAASGIGALFWPMSAAATNRIQRVAVEQSRLGIPLLIGLDVIHGQFTTFPIPLAMAASLEPADVECAARTSAEEARSGGVNWTFAPMIDVSRDPRWGRVAEGFGEDPLITSRMAAGSVAGFQTDDLAGPATMAACAKHFIGYGAGEGGRDYNTVDMSELRLRSTYLPSFASAVDAGVATVMASFNTFNGVPVHANRYLLTDVLRGELGFAGAVVGDASGVENLVPHGLAHGLAEAATLAYRAGLSIEMGGNMYSLDHGALLDEGDPEVVARVEEACRIVLRLKMAMGLFDNPYVDEATEVNAPSDHTRQRALNVARHCPVLLTNDGTLPLSRSMRRVLLAGPGADSLDHLGAWVQQAFAAPPTETLADALGELLGSDGPELVSVGQMDPLAIIDADIERVRDAAAGCDVIVLALEEPSQLTGEATSRASLRLPGGQERLIAAATATGIPVVVVLTNGRPLVVADWIDQPNAVLEAWHLGIEGPRAIADILLGHVSPSGRLPMAFPRHEGQLPACYDAHENTGRPASVGGSMRKPTFDVGLDGPANLQEFFTSKYRDLDLGPQFSFGHGLSYADLSLDTRLGTDSISLADLDAGATITVEVTLSNASSIDVEWTPLVFVTDVVASIAPAVRRLADFKRLRIRAHGSATWRCQIGAEQLGFHTGDARGFIVEPGEFRIHVAGTTDTATHTLTVTAR
ncbi:glycoside hydrolase family 3 C-terminal domain-containing protein [Nanchangia anserum]|uniref:beta-glucosidase n=1 Tax=Nanchangia anserum TaxID=2692125 RepID=A0A8I0GDW0_9ACTO|nr:glycoside hydrolase family 3 N-terminal domain-containing protein [Nanchangia anserum]MBD3689733.1 glycoside hydrolase family 3 C-terminal domain-containing protein [Nanchangia anserum]QOX81905.1 glycoside hydrolase family 3 C-terminal domain-containing protein [Nanchangia anserum]